jgi:phosphoribosylformimino-5-aminoimidazole carboxamide ribotide isomerase
MTATPFIVYPAIDLRGGSVVRLQEGDPNRQTVYGADPAEAARRWIAHGARWLHVVNLDGAFGEAGGANLRALQDILRAAAPAGVPVQFGGGLRSAESIQAALELGVARVVLGTAVIEQPALLADALRRWGAERVAAGLDARDGLVQVRGWQSATPVEAAALARSLAQGGLSWLIFTDIARDGLQSGLNLAATAALAEGAGLNVIASGGGRGMQDARQAKAAGLAGVIVGRALYEAAVDPAALFQIEGD